ncbi:MAG: PHP domain-containing protein, partial [Thermoleophilia bacterium]|nr:PHP domain-containing protein [Thermoleophilia bacterium]
EQMALAARARGLDYLCFADHSQSLAMTGGLNPERLLDQIKAIRDLDDRVEGIRLLAGIEVDILSDGRLDLPDEALAGLDFVTASIHSGFGQPRAKIMHRLTAAMRNPHVRSIGHPSGRLLGRREPYDVDLDELTRVAVETGTYLEVNGSPDRLDLTAQAARYAAAAGVTLVVSSDAHSPDDFENLRYGIGETRRGWLRAADIANSHTWDEIRHTG